MTSSSSSDAPFDLAVLLRREPSTLVDHYRHAAGEHPDGDEYRATMVADRRVLMVMTVERIGGESIRS